jgi:hypothetical protein
MNAYFNSDEALDYSEADLYEASDYSEAKIRRPIRPSQARPVYRPPISQDASRSPVTQMQLKAATDELAAQNRKTAASVDTANKNIIALSNQQKGMGSALKKEIADRKKDSEAQRKALQATKEAVILSSLLFPPGSKGGLSTLGPILLLGDGLTGSTGSSTEGGLLGGGSSGLLLVALLASGGLTK